MLSITQVCFLTDPLPNTSGQTLLLPLVKKHCLWRYFSCCCCCTVSCEILSGLQLSVVNVQNSVPSEKCNSAVSQCDCALCIVFPVNVHCLWKSAGCRWSRRRSKIIDHQLGGRKLELHSISDSIVASRWIRFDSECNKNYSDAKIGSKIFDHRLSSDKLELHSRVQDSLGGKLEVNPI